MMIDMGLLAYLPIGVAVIGAYLWLKPKDKPKRLGGSGVGDQGQL